MPTVMRNGVPTHISVEEYNETLAKHRKEVLGVDENTGKLRHYNVEDLGKIWVNGQEFSGMAYQGLMTVNTKTYVEEPTRSNDGSIPNINDHDTFVVPRCKVNFKYFNIEDYRRLCNAVMSNEFTVKYYDKQFNEFVLHKMYCEPEEMAKLYNVGTDVFGVLDYEVSFIGTLNDMEIFSVSYNANGGTKLKEPQPYDDKTEYKKGDMVYLVETVGNEQTFRYFQAIYFDNKVYQQALDKTDYWTPKSVSEYNSTAKYYKGNVVYKINIDDKENKTYAFYISVFDGEMTNKPLIDTFYWKKINVNKFDLEKTYSSHKTSTGDTALGDFVYTGTLPVATIYEATYFKNKFIGEYPTNKTYWSSMTYEGISVRWGESIVVEDPEDLFNAPTNEDGSKKTFKGWNTDTSGTGFEYKIGQSLNVFKNMTLYAIWE